MQKYRNLALHSSAKSQRGHSRINRQDAKVAKRLKNLETLRKPLLSWFSHSWRAWRLGG